MKKLLVLTVVAFSFLQGALFAQDGERSPALRLYELTNAGDSALTAAMAAFTPALNQMENQGVPAGAIVEIKGAALEFFTDVFEGDEFSKGIVDLYTTHFTDAELEEMIAFYQSPLGQKTLRVMPQIVGDSAQLGQKIAGEDAPKFEQRISEIIKRHQELEKQNDAPAE